LVRLCGPRFLAAGLTSHLYSLALLLSLVEIGTDLRWESVSVRIEELFADRAGFA
jgi:hypothetical protein